MLSPASIVETNDASNVRSVHDFMIRECVNLDYASCLTVYVLHEYWWIGMYVCMCICIVNRLRFPGNAALSSTCVRNLHAKDGIFLHEFTILLRREIRKQVGTCVSCGIITLNKKSLLFLVW